MPAQFNRDEAHSVIQQADGKLVMAGYSGKAQNVNFSLVCLNANGSLDTSFANGGKFISPKYGYNVTLEEGWSVIQQTDGKLVVAGNSVSNKLDREFGLIRLNTDGSIDTSFNGIPATTANLSLTGKANNDNLTGEAGNDTLNGLGGNDNLNGGDGIDAALYTGAKASHTITRTGSAFTVSSASKGTDTLTGIERLTFSDVKVAFDMEGSAGTAAMMMGVLLGKSSLQNKALVGKFLGLTDSGQTLADLSQLVVSNGIVSSLAGGAGNDPFVRLILRNVIGSDASGELVTSLTTLLDSGVFTQSSLLTTAAGLDLNKAQIDLVGLSQAGLEYV